MNKHLYFYITIATIILVSLFYIIGTIRITAEFSELEPFKHNIPVYYKGFKLGNTTKIKPGADYQTTLVDMRIKYKGIQLPINTSAIIRRKDKKDYIELIYPNAPYLETLKQNSHIKGSIGTSFENYIQDQAINGGLDEIKNNINSTIKSAGETFEALTGMLYVMTDILNDVRPSINTTVNNFETTSNNLADISNSLKNSVNKGYIDSTLYNIQETSGNLVVTTKNFGGFSDSLNKQSSVLTNCLLKNLNIVTSNINEIIIGVGNTLKKSFGGIRLLFGKTIQCEK